MKRGVTDRLPAIVGLPQILLMAALVLATMVFMDFNRRLANAQRLVNDATQLANEVATLRVQRDILATEKAYANSDQAVEEWARSVGKEVQPGEVLVIPLPPGGVTPTSPPAPSPAPIELPNYRLWWNLFFDVGGEP